MSRDDSSNRWFEPALFQHLPPEECRELLAAKSVGRVGFNGPEGVQVLPVNYVVHRRSIFFRTAADGALANAMRHSRVAFEIDDIDEFLQRGWSVVAIGDAELVDDQDTLVELWGEQGPKPWAVGLRTQFVRITPIRLTGRRVLQQ
ncbi:pyridoxamine 5'-phosphate oxidase family protein [Kribbella sp. NBC_01510]|uniref:pyridoxamine 5'-phosphate oxidase family protein n=1 Tax=Kribbella sp. NBC_01510 TaxID=2903581 RepID=UPI00386E292C